MLEWLKRHAWKACKRQNRFAGSNPVLSASFIRVQLSPCRRRAVFFVFCILVVPHLRRGCDNAKLIARCPYRRLRLSLPSLFTKTPRFHIFTFSHFHIFTNSQIHKFTNSQIHKFTISPLHRINLPKRCYRLSSRPYAKLRYMSLLLSKEEATHADRLRKSDRITIDVDLCRLSCCGKRCSNSRINRHPVMNHNLS